MGESVPPDVAAMARAAEVHGPIDCLVACAGGALPGLLLHTSVDDYQRAMDVNYMGTLKSVKAVVEGMVEGPSALSSMARAALLECGLAVFFFLRFWAMISSSAVVQGMRTV